MDPLLCHRNKSNVQTQALIGKNSYWKEIYTYIHSLEITPPSFCVVFSRVCSRWPVFVCLYLWCGSETGLLLAAGRCRDAALGMRSCLRWVLLLTGLCCWHACCNPALGKPTNSHSGLSPTTGQFCHATLPFGQSRTPNGHSMTLDLWDDSISHQRIWDTEAQLQAWPFRHWEWDVYHTQRASCS